MPSPPDRQRRDSRTLLLGVLRNVTCARDLDLREWDRLVPLARRTGVLARLAVLAQEGGLFDQLPGEVRPHLEAARLVAQRQQVLTDWEVNRIEWALGPIDVPIVLLKGAAYQAIRLPTANGRLTADVDILVPRDRLDDVERALLSAGWVFTELDSRDQRYFRRWMHELPPLRHQRRGTMLDVHHTILPPTDRLRVDPALLIEASVALPGRRARVLAPADMMLHASAHLFRNGRWTSAVRDLLDLEAMIVRFAAKPSFWVALEARAERLDLRMPCAAALRALETRLGTTLPESVRSTLAKRPQAVSPEAILDRLAGYALMPRDQPSDAACRIARSWLSYWPVPRLSAVVTPIFWTKRLPRGATGLLRTVVNTAAPAPPDR